MKRMLIAFLLCAVLCACLPTPTEEYVVSKSDNLAEQKILGAVLTEEQADVPEARIEAAQSGAPTDRPESEPERQVKTQFFPTRLDEEATPIRDHVTLAIHADVESKADGVYPVYRTRMQPFTAEQVIALATKLLGKPKERELIDTPTKQEWGEFLKAYLDEVAAWEAWVQAGKPNDGVDRDEAGYDPAEVERETERYMKQIRNAPDKLDKTPVSDYAGYRMGEYALYTLEDGGYAQISSGSIGRQMYNVLEISKGCRHHPNLYRQSQYESDKPIRESLAQKAVKAWRQPTLLRADAEAITYREIERLGFTGFSIAYGQPANLYDSTETGVTYVASGWSFTLRRDYDGYPSVDRFKYASSSLLEFGDGDGYAYNEPVSIESVTVFVDETGVWYLGCSAQREIVGKANANVELLPFEEIVRIVKNTLNVSYPAYRFQGSEDRTVDLEVYRMVLTTYTLRIRDSDDFYETPCWVVFFDGWFAVQDREAHRNDPNFSLECIVINAIDGTVVHAKAGY